MMHTTPTTRAALSLALLAALALPAAPAGAAQKAKARSGGIVRVRVREANVRTGPGTRFRKVWRAPKNYPYRVVRRKGKWLNVRDFGGHTEWIYAPLTDRRPAVVVKVKSANVRTGPGTRFGIAFTADKAVPFLVLRRKGGWLKVRHADGDEGWIFAKLVWGRRP